MMEININIKNSKIYLIALLISIISVILLLFQDIYEAHSTGSVINYTWFFSKIVLPLSILYILGILLILSIKNNIKKDIIGWIMIGYTFTYYFLFLLYIAIPKAGPAMQIEGLVFLSEFGWELFIFGLEVAILPAFIFNTLLFYFLKMKIHTIASIFATINSIIFFIFFMQMSLGK